ncbi:hypothetical protein J3F83DRAFT_746275 [Trichoderma novae-zelandiae]
MNFVWWPILPARTEFTLYLCSSMLLNILVGYARTAPFHRRCRLEVFPNQCCGTIISRLQEAMPSRHTTCREGRTQPDT